MSRKAAGPQKADPRQAFPAPIVQGQQTLQQWADSPYYAALHRVLTRFRARQIELLLDLDPRETIKVAHAQAAVACLDDFLSGKLLDDIQQELKTPNG